VNLALALSNTLPQEDIGLMDADIFGPSIPTMMNLSGNPELTARNKIKPLVNYNVKWYFQNVVITGFFKQFIFLTFFDQHVNGVPC